MKLVLIGVPVKLAMLAILVGGCITIVQETPSPDAGSGSGSGGGSEDGGVDPDGCTFAASDGPDGTLRAFEHAPDGTQWMLVGSGDDGLTTLWRRTNGAWSPHVFDQQCFYGVLAVDAQSRAQVACGVPNATIAADDVRLFVATSTGTTTSRLIAAPTVYGDDASGGRPSSIVLGANGRATVLWLETDRGFVSVFSTYRLSRDTGAAWQTSNLFAGGNDLGTARNDNGKLALLGGELHFAVRMTGIMDVVVYRVTGTDLDSVFRASANDVRAYQYAFDYDVAKSADGKLHFAYADASDVYTDVAPGLVNHFRKTGESPAVQTWVDGPMPIGAAPAGLGGISMTLDAKGTPYVSYASKAASSLRIAYLDASTWIKQDVAMGIEVGDSFLRFDMTGGMHVAFEDVENGKIALLDESCP